MPDTHSPPLPGNKPRTHLLGPRRRGFQWTVTGAVVLVPFLRVGGRSLLRVDVNTHRLLAFGRVYHLEEFALVLALALAVSLTFVLVTLVFGRVWCGWACPQTTWVDLYEGLARRLGARVEGGRLTTQPWQTATLHAAAAGLGLFVGANLVWYFLPPREYVARLGMGTLPVPAAVTTVLVGALVYVDLAFVRRTFCKEFCPYGRYQTVLVDRGTLTLRLLPGEAERCIDCRSCVRSCPTGIDIRDGDDVACIDCGRCMDACRRVMAARGQQGLIGYTFGTSGAGVRALATPRTALVAVVAVAAWGALIFTTGHRPKAGFVVRRASVVGRVLADGRTATFFSGILSNRSETPLQVDLEAESAEGAPLGVKGPVAGLTLAPGERRPVQFAVVADVGGTTGAATLRWRAADGTAIAERNVFLAPSENQR